MRLYVVVISGLILLLSAFPLLSQDSASCGGGAFLERVDSLYAEHQASWDAEDDLASFIGVEGYHAELGEIIESCRSVVELQAAGVTETGSGAIDDPYAFNFFADVDGDTDWRLRVSQVAYPETIGGDSPADNGKFVVFVVDVQCVNPEHIFCEINSANFNLIGSRGIVYDYSNQEYVRGELNAELAEGGKSSGLLAYHIHEDENNLRLAYYLDYRTRIFFSGEPAPGQVVVSEAAEITITSTTALRVRSGPGTTYAVVGSFPNGSEAPATGRNNAGTWVQFERGWVFAKYVNADGDIMSLPVSS